ncbi:MAG: CoA-binding protein [Candidatus Sericytochromatia bacterium]
MAFNNDPIEPLLRTSRTIAVVGLSDSPARDSYRVARYLQGAGYKLYAVNPTIKEALGLKAYASLSELPESVDLVNVFRRPEFLPEIVDEAIASGAKALWLQYGVVHEAAARKARDAGLQVVMDRCIKVDHARLRA